MAKFVNVKTERKTRTVEQEYFEKTGVVVELSFEEIAVITNALGAARGHADLFRTLMHLCSEHDVDRRAFPYRLGHCAVPGGSYNGSWS